MSINIYFVAGVATIYNGTTLSEPKIKIKEKLKYIFNLREKTHVIWAILTNSR